jgi:UDP-glucose 4-epimerase
MPLMLVTGGAGFIGSHLVDRLLAEGHAVVVVDDLSLGSARHVSPAARLVEMDCAALAFVDLVRGLSPARIYHLAANSDIRAGAADPTVDLRRTLQTTLSVLEATRVAGVRQLVFASTSAIYGELAGPLAEDAGPLRPVSHYGAAKLASEAWISSYGSLHGLEAWVFRFPNVVGPRLTHGVIHDFLRRLAADPSALVVLGDGSQTKPYLHVDDLLDAVHLATAGPPGVWNIAGVGETSVRSIAERCVAAVAPGAAIRYGTGDRGWVGDVPRFSYDTTRIRSIGWVPRYDSDQAVASAIRTGRG